MAVYTDRESFIPYRRTDVIHLCLRDGRLPKADETRFEAFCEILSAYYHFLFHKKLELLKDRFAPINPDADTQNVASDGEPPPDEAELITAFEDILHSANYARLTEQELRQAFQTETLIPLKTFVDFSDFDRMLLYHRGKSRETVTVKKLLRKRELSFDVFERVVLLIRFKEARYFASKRRKPVQPKFTPGKMYVYLYKKVPTYDLDILFPNVDVSMNWKDRVAFAVPAFGGLVPVIGKALPNLVLILGVILFFTLGPEVSKPWGADETMVRNFLPILTATISLGFILGGFAVRQYLNYKNKRLKFLKNVTDTLFFKNIDCNVGVFHALIDAAEEEECKEIILMYYFLLSQGAMTKQELDDRIEHWLEERFRARIDFDVDKALARVQAVAVGEKRLVTVDADGRLHAMALAPAQELIDTIWDDFFQYHRP